MVHNIRRTVHYKYAPVAEQEQRSIVCRQTVVKLARSTDPGTSNNYLFIGKLASFPPNRESGSGLLEEGGLNPDASKAFSDP